MPMWGLTSYREYLSATGPGASPEMSFANDASWATRIFDIPWWQQQQAVDDFLGWAQVIPTGLTSPLPMFYINRNTPMPFPFYGEQFKTYTDPNGTTITPSYVLFCTKINRVQGIRFVGDYSVDSSFLPLPDFQLARMELGFETLPYDILADQDNRIIGAGAFPDESLLTRYVTKLSSPNSDYITLNSVRGQFLYAEGVNSTPTPSAVNFSLGKLYAQHDFRFRWEQVPKEAVPSQVIDPSLSVADPIFGGAAVEWTLGRVNNNWFPPQYSSQLTGYPPGTLVLLAAQITPMRSAAGRRIYTVEYHMKYRPVGWHRIYGPLTNTTGGFVEVSTDGKQHAINSQTPDGVHLYDVADFAWLFRPPQRGVQILKTTTPPWTLVPGGPP